MKDAPHATRLMMGIHRGRLRVGVEIHSMLSGCPQEGSSFSGGTSTAMEGTN
jgi:hypothetical protein